MNLSDIEAVVMDMDGVLWRGDEALPGLTDFFQMLRERDLPFVLATNNSSVRRVHRSRSWRDPFCLMASFLVGRFLGFVRQARCRPGLGSSRTAARPTAERTAHGVHLLHGEEAVAIRV